MTEYPELQEFIEELEQDGEVKAKRLGTPPQFESRTMDGDLSTNPASYQNASRDDIVAEMIAQGIHAMVQLQQIDTLWRLYDQGQKEIEQLRTEKAHLQEQLEHHSRAPSPIPSTQTNGDTSTSFANLLLPRLKQPRAPRRVKQDPPPSPRENREGSAATSRSQTGKRSAKLPDPPKLTDGVDPTFRKWSMQMESKFEVNHDHFESDRAKVAYIVDRTGGDAYAIIESYLEAGHRSTPSELIQLLSKRFDDPHRRFKAKDELAKLTMKPFGDFSTHISEFIRLANLAHLTKEQWKEDLHNSLYSKLKSSMILYRTNSHVEFEEYCNIAQEMAYGLKQENDESRERRENSKQRQQTRNNPSSKPPQTSTSPPLKPQDTQGNQKSQSEITCYGCGKKGHIRPNCPERKPDTSIKIMEPAELPTYDDPNPNPEN